MKTKITIKRALRRVCSFLPNVSNLHGEGIVTIFCAGALLLSGCTEKEDSHSNTSHPDHGQITLTTDWSQCTAGIDIPASYTVAVGDYSATVSDATNTLDQLFEPGTYDFRIYNTPEHVSVNGSTFTVAQASGNADGVGQFVQEMPGWLFTSTLDADIEADIDYELTAVMQQQVRQLTILLEPASGIGMTDYIESIEGYLTGAASTFDMGTGVHGGPRNVALTFTKVADGANAGKWAATVRLLGVAGSEQRLHARISFQHNDPEPITLTGADGSDGSDLTAELTGFNEDKKTPLTLDGKVKEVETPAGLTAIIDWTTGEDGPVVID